MLAAILSGHQLLKQICMLPIISMLINPLLILGICRIYNKEAFHVDFAKRGLDFRGPNGDVTLYALEGIGGDTRNTLELLMQDNGRRFRDSTWKIDVIDNNRISRIARVIF